jgi:hypothetical protein
MAQKGVDLGLSAMKFDATEYPIAPSLFEYKNMENARQIFPSLDHNIKIDGKFSIYSSIGRRNR